MILVAFGMVERERTCGIFHQPEVEGVNGVHWQQKTIRCGPQLNCDTLTFRHVTTGALYVHRVQELRSRGMNVERAHLASVHQPLSLPGSALRTAYGYAIFRIIYMFAVAKLPDVVEDPEVAAGLHAPGGRRVVQFQRHGFSNLQRPFRAHSKPSAGIRRHGWPSPFV